MKYYRPTTFDELYSISDQDFTLFVGGTDLIPRYERGQILPKTIIDLKKLPEFIGINKVGDNIAIGAGTTIEDIKNSNLIKKHFNQEMIVLPKVI